MDMNERESREAISRYDAMARINRIGRRTLICVLIIAICTVAYKAWLIFH